MICHACGNENPAAHRFCGSCGLALGSDCGRCGASSAPGQRFCGACGTALDATVDVAHAVAEVVASPPSPSDAERRLVTVLFVDLVGFTAFSEERDPEAVRDLQTAYFDQARVIVDRYGGVTEKFIGDAVMAVWGTPVTNEDDAERAVRAGLDLVDAVEALGEAARGPRLRARAGVVTGEAAVRLDAIGQGMVTGDVVNTAARVQAVAAPGTVLVDDATRASSSSAIAYAGAGEHTLKGRAEPTRLFTAEQVVAGSGGAQRFDGLEPPFLGRERELRALKELFHETVERSRARLVVVSGAAGVGKSRLGWEFFKYLDGIALLAFWHVGRCLAYGEGVAYWALAEMIRMRLRISEGDPEAVIVSRLDDGLLEYVHDPEERAWLRPRLAVLLGVGGAIGAASDDLERDSLFAGWRRFLERLSEVDPVVLLFEDTQAADAGLLDFVDHVLEWAAERPIFLIALARPELREARPSWSGHHSAVTVMHLDPLRDEVVERLLDGVVKGLPEPTREALAARAEGIPLFAIETVRMLIDRDAVVPRDGEYVLAEHVGDVADLGVPPTLQALAAARLDSLPDDERRLVKDASVLGLSFTPAALTALVRDIGDIGAEQVDGLLASLVRKEVLTLRSDSRSPEAGQYRFVQKLMRTVAYGVLSRRDRKQRHLAAASTLADSHEADDIAGVLATHYLEAADAVPDDADADELRAAAVRHLERAGERARGLAADDEAQRYFERALELATDDEARARLAELAGFMAYRIGDPTRSLDHYALAHALHDRVGDLRQLARVTSREGDALMELDRAADALELMTGVHDRLGGEVLDAESAQLANSIATALIGRGDPADAGPWLERASTAAEAAGAWEILGRAFNVRGIMLTWTSRPVEGLALMRAALDLALQHDMPNRAAIQSGNVALELMARDLVAAERLALDSVAYARRVGDQWTHSFAHSTVATVRVHSGAWDQIDTEALHRQLRSIHGPARYMHLLPLTALAVWRGTDHDLGSVVSGDPPFDDPQSREQQLTVLALLASQRGDLDQAIALGEEAVRARSAIWSVLDTGAISWPLFVTTALDAGRVDLARETVDEVAAQPAGLIPPLLVGLLRWFEARLAALDGDHDRAPDLFVSAQTILKDMGAPFWLGRALLDHATWAAEHGAGRQARTLASEARDIFAGLGARPFLEQADQVLARHSPGDEVASDPAESAASTDVH